MKKNTIMRCASCGLTVETVSDQGCTQCVVCCTEPMEELEAKTAEVLPVTTQLMGSTGKGETVESGFLI